MALIMISVVIQSYEAILASFRVHSTREVLLKLLEVENLQQRNELFLDLCVEQGIKDSRSFAPVTDFRSKPEVREHWLSRNGGGERLGRKVFVKDKREIMVFCLDFGCWKKHEFEFHQGQVMFIPLLRLWNDVWGKEKEV
jgi:hypothetical protein